MSEIKVPQIVAIGELLWDLLPGGARLGGAPSNFAVFCARLGNRTVLVSSVGDDDYGRAAGRLLVQPNLDLRQLQNNETHPTGTVEVTFSPESQPIYNIIPDVAWDFIALTPELLEAAHAADAVCFGMRCRGRPFKVCWRPRRLSVCAFATSTFGCPIAAPRYSAGRWAMPPSLR
jgi:sugar/nucleoside kinase (ribokinase family)